MGDGADKRANMMITLKCKTCGMGLEIPDEYQGQTGKCNHCGNPVAVPFQQPQNTPTPQILMVRQAKTRFVYILLGLFLGHLGLHNFYAGYTGRAFAQLLITLCLFWLIIPLFIVAIWVWVELFVITNDATGQPFA